MRHLVGNLCTKLHFFFSLYFIEPLRAELVRLLLDGIRYDRLGSGSGSTGRTQFQSDATIKGVISSFVEVEEYKKKGNLDVRFFI